MKKLTYLEEDSSKRNLEELIKKIDPSELERERFQNTEFEKTYTESNPLEIARVTTYERGKNSK